jgi:hypothetical protein
MIPVKFQPTPPWETFEVVDKAKSGPGSVPFSEELNGHGDPLGGALGKMWTVGFHGPHEARRKMLWKKKKRTTPLIIRADDFDPPVWVLKAKPDCWRLFFYVYENQEKGQHWIVYLKAICKKKNKAAYKAEASKARTRLPSGASSRYGIRPFRFPTR